MRWLLCNGSPRGPKSNTRILLEHFARGLEEGGHEVIDTLFLVRGSERERHLSLFISAEAVLIAFPLYTDAMPGLVKRFFEELHALPADEPRPSLAFLVQSGFPEPAHSRPVEWYLEKLSRRFGGRYLGTAVRGGVEGIQIMPPWMTRKLYRLMQELGATVSPDSGFDDRVLRRLAPRETLSSLRRTFYRIGDRIGIANFYWDSQIKKNDAHADRFARPYTSAE